MTFAYTAYNESGNLIDSTYRQGRNAESQLGVRGMIPGMLKRQCSVWLAGTYRLLLHSCPVASEFRCTCVLR